jgi:hypothetical protein
MRRGCRYFILLTVLIVVVLSVVGTPFVGQVTASINVAELDSYSPGDLIIVEPKNTTYVDVVPLNIVVTNGEFEPTSVYYNYPLWGGGYSYSIDGQDNVTITTGSSPNITLTSLDSGGHCIVVYSYFYVAWGQLAGPFCQSSEPVYFSVITTQEPQNKTSLLLILSISGATVIVIGSILFLYKKRVT